MSARALLSTATRALRPSVIPVTARRSITQTPRTLLKESASTDPSAADFEHHKQDSLAKQKAGQAHWKPELASVSEESVKADRMAPEEASEAAMKRLQEQTKGRAEETRKKGTSMRDGL
ncbi:hypothetical protein NEMBOFW57_009959 [Staphylotrichum longicolle]|uniref:Mitochondrial carrier protein pet8 n=1 Tax=Staphylotrichum longicolle TaxID=669026 RepID=A0AAD4ETP8_9PEZI|nr:hypothetical protein NEMBOFW57_009959 [Staphylotrichum longicolle]